MAELVVGLSKSVVVGAITKVQAVIEEDAKVQKKMRRNFVFITLELEMMQSFLDDANQEMKNNLVSTWVKRIRQLAYEIEDFVEFFVELDDKPVFWRRLLPLCITPPLLVDEAVEELEQLKCRVEDVNNCYRRYNLINVDSAGSSKLAAAIQQRRQSPAPGASDMLSEARDATKRRHGAFGNLTQLINKKDNDLQVISLWGGTSNHGTTSIIRETFTHPEICQDFTYRAWVKLMHPLNPHRFIRSLMSQFYTNSCKEENAATKGMHVLTKMKATQVYLFDEFKLLTLEKRFLIVLEGLSTIVDWDAISTFLPDTKNGSCIILSTQQPEIASLCLGNFYDILELKKFSEDHSVCALFKEPRVDEVIQSSLSGMRKKEAQDWMRDQPLIERQSEINELRECVAKTRISTSNVVSVWGMAGIGKSSLVKYLYFDRMCHGDLFDKFTWVDVSRPFNLRSIYRSLLLDLYSEKDPVEECLKLLEQHNCLVVIDDLQSKEEWDLIEAALVSRHSSSVIIAITTEASIARYCTNDETQVFNVQCLEAAAAFDLFRAEVHKKQPSSPLVCHKDVELDNLILKCGGIPRVIACIAGQLATETVTSMDTVHSLNQRFMYHLEIDPKFGTLQSLFRWMHSVILNPPDFLKPCIFYLSIFPQNCYIRQRRVLRRWIAEGYSKESVERHAEENAENFFSELVQLSIFKQVDTTASTGMGSYMVNGFIHEYIVSHPMEENLVFELRDTFAPTTQHRGRHLIIREYWKRDRVVFMNIDFSRLRSLTVFGKWESFFVSRSMMRLQVLDLENAHSVKDTDLEKMVKQLRYLKFLSLRGCSEIRNLPSSLGDLMQLQTLDIRYTSIVTMPASMARLQRLQYIRAGTSNVKSSATHVSSSWFSRHRRLVGDVVPGAVVVPEGIGKLIGLHTLGVVNVAASGEKAFLKVLRKLTKLRKLGVAGINSHRSKYFFAMSDNAHLESLSVQLDKDSEDCLDVFSMPWENLQSLKLYGLQNKLPISPRNHLSKLRKLALEMDTLQKNDMELLTQLPELGILRLRVKQQLQDGKLHFYAEINGLELTTFKKVRILEISCSSSELQVTFGSKSMKNLELLKIDYSSGTSYQLAGMNNLSELKQVLLKGTDDEQVRTQFASQLANHPRQPVVKLEEQLPRWS